MGLTLWPRSLECWLTTVSVLSAQVRNPVGLLVPGRYTGGSSIGMGKAQRIDSSFRANWLSCFWPDLPGGLPGLSGATAEGSNVTTQRHASRLYPLAELVRVLAQDSECAVSPGSKSSGVAGAGTLHCWWCDKAWSCGVDGWSLHLTRSSNVFGTPQFCRGKQQNSLCGVSCVTN